MNAKTWLNKNKSTIFIVTALLLITTYYSVYYLSSSSNSYINIDVSEAKELIETDPSIVILDVRTDGEYHSEHIEGAINIPVDELEQRIGEMNPNTKLLVYCRTGNRSTIAAQTLLENGFTGFYHMQDGIEAWKQAGYPTISTI
jgi:rhodanese-related sulfurtransferase